MESRGEDVRAHLCLEFKFVVLAMFITVDYLISRDRLMDSYPTGRISPTFSSCSPNTPGADNSGYSVSVR